jgi:hypothetical protein
VVEHARQDGRNHERPKEEDCLRRVESDVLSAMVPLLCRTATLQRTTLRVILLIRGLAGWLYCGCLVEMHGWDM